MKKRFSSISPWLIALSIVLIFNIFIAKQIVVSGSSMESTLHDSDRGYGLVVYGFSNIDRGEIVTFIHEDHYLIKRVIGLPNDTVEIKDGIVYINGKELNEPYLDEGINTFGNLTLALKNNEYFVLGDNRNNSKDSRIFGPVNRKDMETHGLLILTPGNFGIK